MLFTFSTKQGVWQRFPGCVHRARGTGRGVGKGTTEVVSAIGVLSQSLRLGSTEGDAIRGRSVSVIYSRALTGL